VKDQLDLFADQGPELHQRPVQPDGQICTDAEIDETIVLRGRRIKLEIQLARDGPHWLFSTIFRGPAGGYGYRVGRKWGKYTGSRADALHYARQEITTQAASFDGFREVPGLLEKLQ
jgi:hypothetical protein